MELGFRVYLPLHLARYDSRPREAHIVPLWQGYLFVKFDVSADDWHRILRARGIGGIIGNIATGRPIPLAEGVIEELIGRTSARRIVDDPGANPPLVGVERAHWHDITRLPAKARTELLLRLFGRADVAAA